MSDSVRPHRRSPSGSTVPGILQARTLEWFHFLLQCMKVKSESEVAQSCPTLSDPMDCSLPGSSVHGIFQARVLEWGAIAFSGVSLKRTLILLDQDLTLRSQFSSFQLLRKSDPLQPHELQHARLPCPLPTPGVYPNPCPLSW